MTAFIDTNIFVYATGTDPRGDTRYSEDMHDGLVVAGLLTIRDPFA